jgi:hypothetical protein
MTGIWLAFLGFILILLFLDLGVFHRKARAVNVREALGWSAVWIALGLSFAAFRYRKVSLALVLARVGGKMLAAPLLKGIFGGNYSLYLPGLVLLVLAGDGVARGPGDLAFPSPVARSR